MYTSPQYEMLAKEVNIKYTDMLIKRNPNLIDAAIKLHQSGQIPPNTFVLDLDAHRRNADAIVKEARKHDVSLYYMSKQVGRNPLICKAVLDAGFRGIVAVEMQCARTLHRYGIRIAHVGHLVQPPVNEIDYVLSMNPEVWTVYSVENAKVLSQRAQKAGKVQDILVQPVGKGDVFFDTMSGGIPEEKIIESTKEIMKLPGVRIVGTTSFPCLLYDLGTKQVRPISNFHTVIRIAKRLKQELGLNITQTNVPGNDHASTMKIIAENGGTHAEPGNGVSGTNTWQVYEEQPEVPAFTYVSEVSHWLGDKLYTHGGGTAFSGGGWGIYPDGSLWVGGTDIAMDALVGSSLQQALSNRVRAKFPGTDPFNYNLTLYPEGRKFSVGDTVLYGYCVLQIFVTRGWHAVVEGIEDNDPRLVGLFDQGNNLVDKHGHLQGEKATLDMIEKV